MACMWTRLCLSWQAWQLAGQRGVWWDNNNWPCMALFCMCEYNSSDERVRQRHEQTRINICINAN